MIELKKINKKYNNKLILKDINLTFPSKGFVIISGASGSGKSTLINVLTGQTKKTSGKITFFGEKVNRFNKDKLNALYIGEVFQKSLLFDEKTVYENIEISLKIINLLEKFEREAKVEYIIKILGLEKYKNTLCKNLSVGEKMKVQVARSLVKNPKVLVLDEPTAPLDKKSAFYLLTILKEISKQKLVIMVTHDTLALNFAERVITMKNGEVFKDTRNSKPKKKNVEFDGEINLQQFNEKKEFNNISIYGKNSDKLLLVFKDNNIYIKTKKRVIDNVRIIKYTKLTYPKIKLDNLDNSLNDIKYASIYKFSTSFKESIKKILSYYKNNKSLIIGLIFSCYIITFFVSFIMAKVNKNYINYYNKNYIRVKNSKGTLENLKTIKQTYAYVIPENYIKNVEIVSNDLYKLNQIRIKEKMGIIKDKKILKGECKLSKEIAKNILNNRTNEQLNLMINVRKINDLLNKYIIIDNVFLKITEITDKVSALYVSNDDFYEIFSLNNIKPISMYESKIVLLEGYMPKEINDALVSEDATTDKYNITGRYSGANVILVSDKTYEDKYFDKPEYFVYTKNKKELLKQLKEKKIKYYDDYKQEKKIKFNKKRKNIKSTIKILSCFLLLSSSIIYFIIRIVVLEYKTNLSINRILRVKRRDNYLFIMTEVFTLIGATTLLSNGLILILLKELIKIEVLKKFFIVNMKVFVAASLIILLESAIISLYLIKKEIRNSNLKKID